MRTIVFAALLLVSLIACNNPATEQNYSTDSMAITELKQLENQSQKPEYETMARNNDEMFEEGYAPIVENEFLSASDNPLSTFSTDVDDASYSNVRRFINSGSLPPAGAVRIEEMINYFDYEYPAPQNTEPFSITAEISECPWNMEHRLVHIGLQGKEIPVDNLPASNLVFLIDVSGSMDEPNKLPLLKQSMKLLVENLREQDRVAITVYAGSAGLVLPSTYGSEKKKINAAIDGLQSGGSTAGGEGIVLAYKVAKENFINDGNNRVILATDGDFNVGLSSDDELVSLIERERESKVFLSVLGFGTGNYQDNKMQLLANKGNGNHSYIDNINEAKKILVKEFGSTLFTIAKDVKFQVEFNPATVQAYRLIGYENRMLAAADFNDDKKDAGEVGSGHTVTALYELIPAGAKNVFSKSIDPLKYQAVKKLETNNNSDDLFTIKLRYKQPEGNKSMLITKPIRDSRQNISNTSDNFKFSAAVAEFGLLLRNSKFKQNSSYSQILGLAKTARGTDGDGYRKEFIDLVTAASQLNN